ncbi:MAG: thiamine diphosphokinase [Synergistales bacterium]|nr:thiamine diphosphokinase [Synergistales bacterium]
MDSRGVSRGGRVLLPQVEVEIFPAPSDEATLLLVAGGRAPETEWLRTLSAGMTVWAVDRGAEHCFAAGVVPERFIGDADSISQGSLARLERTGVPRLVVDADKDLTDLQLALREASHSHRMVMVTGCWGGRYDHTASAVHSALWARDWGVPVTVYADQQEMLIPLGPQQVCAAGWHRFPSAVSLLPLGGSCHILRLKGTFWELADTWLDIKKPYAVSNRPALGRGGELLEIEVGRGVAGLYGWWEG